jgi:hypothetical protein
VIFLVSLPKFFCVHHLTVDRVHGSQYVLLRFILLRVNSHVLSVKLVGRIFILDFLVSFQIFFLPDRVTFNNHKLIGFIQQSFTIKLLRSFMRSTLVYLRRSDELFEPWRVHLSR